MNKILISILAIIVVIVGFKVITRPKQPTDTATVASPTASPAQYTLAVTANDVSIKSNGQADFTKITGTVMVGAGTEVKTSVSGRAKLLYPNGTITTIQEDSTLKIEDLDKNGSKSKLTLISGAILSKIKNALGADEYYNVESDNVVASVRGTIFASECRKKICGFYGIESKVKVQGWDPIKKKLIEGSDVEITSGEKTTVDQDTPADKLKKLLKKDFTDEDFKKAFIKREILENLDNNDLKDDKAKAFFKHMAEYNQGDKEFIRRLIERRLINNTTVSPTPTQTPRTTVTPKPTRTPTTTITVSPSSTSSPSPSPTPTVVISADPTLDSVFPKTIKAGEQFTINGNNFINSKGIKQIQTVLVGNSSVSFFVLDGLTVFATPSTTFAPGIYDVSIVSISGVRVSLSQVITIQ